MKTITGILIVGALAAPAPAAAQHIDIGRDVERIVESALTLAANALDEAVEAREQSRAERIRREQERVRERQREAAERQRASQRRGTEYRDTFTRTLKIGRNGRLEVENLSGDIEVTGVAGDEAKITAIKRAYATSEATARAALKAMEIDVVERGGLVSVSSEPTRGRSGSVDVDYTITVPAGTALALESHSGDLTVSRMTGDIHLEGLSGDILVRESKPRIIEAETVSGAVLIDQVESERVEVETLSGNIEYRGKLGQTGRYDFSSHSGNIHVVTDPNASFQLRAETLSGDVTTDFGLKVDRQPGAGNQLRSGGRGPGGLSLGTEIRGSVGDGGGFVSVESFSGDITISKR
jgi:hypothetical protein